MKTKKIFNIAAFILLSISILLTGCSTSDTSPFDKILEANKINGSTYTNEFIGLNIQGPKTSQWYTEQEIMQTLGVTDEAMYDKAKQTSAIVAFSSGTFNNEECGFSISVAKKPSTVNDTSSLIKFVENNRGQSKIDGIKQTFDEVKKDKIGSIDCVSYTNSLVSGKLKTNQKIYVFTKDNFVFSLASTNGNEAYKFTKSNK